MPAGTVRDVYDLVAEAYTRELYDELDGKPYDRAWLADFAARVSGPVCDMGCGPGQIGQRLAELGCDPVVGVDLSGEMLAQARRLHPGRRFVQDDICTLSNIPDRSFGGIAAFYALVNLDRGQRARAVAAMARVLRPGGLLTVAYHIGDAPLRLEEWFGFAVEIDFYFIDPAEIRALAIGAGLVALRDETRAPIPGAEHPSNRAYQLFQRPPV